MTDVPESVEFLMRWYMQSVVDRLPSAARNVAFFVGWEHDNGTPCITGLITQTTIEMRPLIATLMHAEGAQPYEKYGDVGDKPDGQ